VLTGFGAVTYTWAPPATLSCVTCNPTNATPLVETVYTVTGADRNGCTDTATVTVGLRTHTISNAWGDTAVCFGVPVQLYDTGGHTYQWLPATGLSNPTISNPIATPPYTTIYMAIARLGSCIPDTNQVTVVIYPLPTVDAGPDQRLLAGSTAQIQATGTDIATYRWWPSETLSCPDCPNPVASMTVRTTYTVDVESKYGCRSADSVTILLYCDNSMVFIPNAFTPNSDGQNDVFYPRGAGVEIIKTFRIYNRWGELVFKSYNSAAAWDGTYNNTVCQDGTYTWIIVYGDKNTDKETLIKGNLIETNCNIKDIKKLCFEDVTFNESQDHSKWGVSDKDYYCISDLNRTLSQYKKGGGIFICKDKELSKSLYLLILS
jgi:gliding motility-associated-like protein